MIVYLKLTNNCQLQCTHCYNGDCKKEYISQNTINKEISNILNIANNEHVIVYLHGGEPLLYNNDKILNICHLLHHKNIDIIIGTNLVYKLSSKKLQILSHSGTNNKRWIETSYDVSIRFKNINQQLRWESNIKTLIDNNIDPVVLITLTKHTINTQPQKLIEYLNKLNIKHVIFERLILSGNANKNNQLLVSNRQIDNWLLNFYTTLLRLNSDMQVRNFHGINNHIYDYINVCDSINCPTNCSINTDGTYGGCPVYSDKKIEHLNQCSTLNIKNNVEKQCIQCHYNDICNYKCQCMQFDDSGCPGLINLYSQYCLDNDMLHTYQDSQMNHN